MLWRFVAASVAAATISLGHTADAGVSEAALLAARAAVHAGNCDLQPTDSPSFPIQRHDLPDRTTLVEMPCRLTIRSIMSVFFIEDAGGLHPLFFASALLDYRADQNGRINWKNVRIAGFTAVGELPEAYVDTQAGVVHSSFRVPPGDADGTILSVYRLDDGALIRVEVAINGPKSVERTAVWSAAKP